MKSVGNRIVAAINAGFHPGSRNLIKLKVILSQFITILNTGYQISLPGASPSSEVRYFFAVSNRTSTTGLTNLLDL